MAAANGPARLPTQPDASEHEGSGSVAASKASDVQSVNAAFSSIKAEKGPHPQFESGSKAELKGDLSKLLAHLPPPPGM